MLAECGTAGVRRWGKMCDLICNDRMENVGLLLMDCQSLDRDITWSKEMEAILWKWECWKMVAIWLKNAQQGCAKSFTTLYKEICIIPDHLIIILVWFRICWLSA